MEYKSVKGFSGAAQLGFILVFLGLGFILASGVQLFIAYKMVPQGTPLQGLETALLTAMKNPENVFYSRLMQVTGTFCLFFLPAILYSLVSNGKNKFWLGFNPYLNIYQVLLGFLIMFTANIMAGPLEDISKTILSHLPSLDAVAKKIELLYNDQVRILSNLKSWPEFVTALFIMAFFPALFEEVFFRGALQQLLIKWWKKPLIAIIVTSLLFSLIHGSIYLFLSRAVLGFVLGLLYFKTKNIWVNVIAHFLNNAIAVSQLFFENAKAKDLAAVPDQRIEWWFAIIAVGVLVFLFRFLDRYSEKNSRKIYAQELLLMAEGRSNPFTKTETEQVGN